MLGGIEERRIYISHDSFMFSREQIKMDYLKRSLRIQEQKGFNLQKNEAKGN